MPGNAVKDIKNALLAFYKHTLCLGGRANGANPSARTAGHAGIRIDHELAVTLRDGGNGTFFCAGAARHALVADLICHVQYLLF